MVLFVPPSGLTCPICSSNVTLIGSLMCLTLAHEIGHALHSIAAKNIGPRSSSRYVFTTWLKLHLRFQKCWGTIREYLQIVQDVQDWKKHRSYAERIADWYANDYACNQAVILHFLKSVHIK